MGGVDLSFKSLLDRFPRTAVETFGQRPLDEGAQLELVPREVSLPLKAVDGAVRIIAPSGEQWIEHFESEVGLSGDDRRQILRRAVALYLKYDVPIFTTIVLMARRSSPLDPVPLIGGRQGSLTVAVEPRYLRLWEMPPDSLLAQGNPEVLPWVAAMRATPEQEEAMVRYVLAVRDAEARDRLSAEAVTLAGLKYDKDRVAEFRQRFQMVTTKEILMASVVGEELMEEGREEGRLESTRRHLRRLIAARIPHSAPAPDWLETASDVERLDSLFDALLAAPGEAEARLVLESFRPQ